MRYAFLLNTLFLAIAFLPSCTVRKTDRILRDVDTYIQSRPDSALYTLRAIDPDLLSSRKTRAHYSLLHAMALDKNYIDTTDRSVVTPAVKYYARYGSAEQKMKSWYYLGRIQENGGDNPSANVSFLRAEQWIDADTDERFKAMIWQELSDTYSRSNLFEQALEYAEKSYHASMQIRDTFGADISRYRMAQEYNNLDRLQDADSLYRLLLEEGKFTSNWRAELLSDYAFLMLREKDDCPSAVRLFEEALAAGISLRSANLWSAYAYALTRTGERGRADTIFRRLATEDDGVGYRRWRGRTEASQGDYAAAYASLAAAAEFQNRNISQVLQQFTLAAQRDYMEEENAALQIRAKRQRMGYAAILLGIVLLAGIGVMIFARKRRKMLQNQEILMESFRALSADRDRAKDEREEIRMTYVKMCQTHFRQVGRINEMLHNIVGEKDTLLYKELNKAVKSIHDDEESHKAFEDMLNETLDNVMLHYRESFPGKSERHYHLVGFIFAGFDAATIGSILCDCKKDNAYLQKSRLKKAIRESDSPYKEQLLSYIS